jgi:hypothetical protein
VEKCLESTWESGKRVPSLKTYRILRIAAKNFFTYIWSVDQLPTDTLVGNNFYFDFRFFFLR